MPKIEQYVSQVEAPGIAPQPNQNGEAFGQQVAEQAARTGQAIQGAGDALIGVGAHIAKRAGEAEVSDLTVKMAQTQSEYTQKLQETLLNADPGDQKITEKFVEGYRTNADKIREKITTRQGQEYFDRVNAHLESHFTETANAGQAQLAGVQAKQNIDISTQAMEATLSGDPGAYWTSIKDFAKTNIEAVAKGKLDAKQILELQESTQKRLAEAAVRGFTLADPYEAYDQLVEGKWKDELNSKQIHQLIGEAKVGMNAVDADDAAAEADAERARKAGAELANNKLLARFADKTNPAGVPTVKDILTAPISFEQKKMWVDYKRLHAKGNKLDDRQAYNSMYNRIFLPPNDPNHLSDPDAIRQAAADGQLTPQNAEKLVGLIPKTEQAKFEAHLLDKFMKTTNVQVAGGDANTKTFDQNAVDRQYKWNYYVQKRIAAQRAENKPIEDLLRPASKDYLGNDVHLFQPDPEEIMSSFGKMGDYDMSRQRAQQELAVSTAVQRLQDDQKAPGMIAKGNIDLKNRPRVTNPDGSISTVRSVGVEVDGKEVLLPTVSDDGKNLTVKEAVEQYKKTGKHLGIFKDAASSNAYAQKLHEAQAKLIQTKKRLPGESVDDYLKRTKGQ